MPFYTFKSGKKIQDFLFSMNEAPSIGSNIEIDGKVWTRVILEPPKAQVDSVSKIDPTSSEDFIKKTANHKGTYGDLLDLSADLAKQREEKFGRDVIKDNYNSEKEAKMNKKRARNRAIKESKKIN